MTDEAKLSIVFSLLPFWPSLDLSISDVSVSIVGTQEEL